VDAAACGILMPPIKPIYLLAPILPAGPALPAQHAGQITYHWANHTRLGGHWAGSSKR